MRSTQIIILTSILLIYYIVLGYYNPDTLCLVITLLSLYNFINEFGKTVPIRSLCLMIATVQWVLGPYLSYTYLSPFEYYAMPISKQEYFVLAIPGVLLFALGLYSIKDKYVDEKLIVSALKNYLKGKQNIGLYLIGIGFLATYLGGSLPTSLAFFFYLLANLKYIGTFYIIFSDRRDKFIYVGIVILFLIVDALAMTLFHDLILWSSFTLLLVTLNNKPHFLVKASLLFLGFIIAFTLQAVKGDYRGAVWGGQVTEEVSKTDILESSFYSRVVSDGLFSDTNTQNFIYRINQGWIIGHVMAHTPKVEPFANGETLKDGIIASLLPRFLAPGKALSGGRDYFERYSGLELVNGTSMDLSPLGEAYANFSSMGGALLMFFLGLFYSSILSFISKANAVIPTLILWIPLLFQQAVKAESDITTSINHITKAAIIIFIVYWVADKIFKTKL